MNVNCIILKFTVFYSIYTFSRFLLLYILHIFKVSISIYFTHFQGFTVFLLYLSLFYYQNRYKKEAMYLFHTLLLFGVDLRLFFCQFNNFFKSPAPSYLSLPDQAPCISFPVSHTPCCRY